MAMVNPKGRANYEPNSWGEIGGPRETPMGFQSYPAQDTGPKLRIRPESFADHYSQARLFYISQRPIEQRHIKDALVFELSKVQRPDIRARMVSHLLNIDQNLAQRVANDLRMKDLPAPARAAKPTRQDLPKSDALSIMINSLDTFKGRKLGVLMTDGADAALFNALKDAATKAGAMTEIVAPMIGGVQLSDGSWLAADHKIDGGPSVLFDAVALLVSEDGAELLAKNPAARDFVADAFAHAKFIGYSAAAMPLFVKAGISDDLDEACVALARVSDAKGFVKACGASRFWTRMDN